jgi:hypothetical protein
LRRTTSLARCALWLWEDFSDNLPLLIGDFHGICKKWYNRWPTIYESFSSDSKLILLSLRWLLDINKLMNKVLLFLICTSLITNQSFAQWSPIGDANRGTHWYSTGGGVLGYSIRSSAGGGWAWQFTDGANSPHFHVEFPTGNVGLGTSTPSHKLEVVGNIVLPNSSGLKSIYTWDGSDPNWRIGMSSSPGFNRALATSHVQYLTYGNSAGQGFAVGVNGANSSFELLSTNHQAYFRGNVGIGTTIADGFQVNAPLASQVAQGSSNIRMGIIGNAPRLIFDCQNATPFQIDNSGGQLRIFNPGVVRMVINSDGNVGIGTTAPSAKLNVYNSGPTQVIFGNPSTGTGGFTSLLMGTSADSNGYGYLQSIKSSGTALGDIILNKDGGNVGIGTTNPTQKLTVNGTIYGKEVKVDLNVPGPDYVFEPEYKVMPLDELKKYIERNKHLPEIPSAKEMEAAGINVSEMNMLLLKKIEELTLHVISQQESIVEVKRANQELKRQLQVLQRAQH